MILNNLFRSTDEVYSFTTAMIFDVYNRYTCTYMYSRYNIIRLMEKIEKWVVPVIT